MCTQAMRQKIAEYFKMQTVLKVWLWNQYRADLVRTKTNIITKRI